MQYPTLIRADADLRSQGWRLASDHIGAGAAYIRFGERITVQMRPCKELGYIWEIQK